MGRGKVQLKRIDDKIRRQVTFSKRRSGLIKKARELSVLCSVEVGLIIFSAKGRLYEFCSGESLGKVLERYQIHNDEESAEKNGGGSAKKHPSEWSNICSGSNRSLKMIQSDMESQNIENLDVPELAQLEKQLDVALRQTRSRKTQLLMDTLTALTDKEKQLQEDKLLMEKEIAELKKEKGNWMVEAEEEEPDQQSSSAANTATISSDDVAHPSPKRHTMLNLF